MKETPKFQDIKDIYIANFKDDMFEEHLTHELADKYGSSFTLFSFCDEEIRIEYKSRDLAES